MAIKVTCDVCKKDITAEYWRLYWEREEGIETEARPTGTYLVSLLDWCAPFYAVEMQLCTAECLQAAEAEVRRLAGCLSESQSKVPSLATEPTSEGQPPTTQE